MSLSDTFPDIFSFPELATPITWDFSRQVTNTWMTERPSQTCRCFQTRLPIHWCHWSGCPKWRQLQYIRHVDLAVRYSSRLWNNKWVNGFMVVPVRWCPPPPSASTSSGVMCQWVNPFLLCEVWLIEPRRSPETTARSSHTPCCKIMSLQREGTLYMGGGRHLVWGRDEYIQMKWGIFLTD